MARLF
jgi:hypothetical protein